MSRTLAPLALLLVAWSLPSVAETAGLLEAQDLVASVAGPGSLSQSISRLDPQTGQTVVLETQFAAPLDVEFRDDGELFFTTVSGTELFRLNVSTGVTTDVGSLAGHLVGGLEFAEGLLYGAAEPPTVKGVSQASRFVLVDPDTAALTPIADLPYTDVHGLAYQPTTGTMYGVGVPIGAGRGFSSALFTVDRATGATSEIADLGSFIGALEFGPDGRLYAGQGSAGSAALLVLDPQTGAVQQSVATAQSSLLGLSFVPGNRVALDIPALGSLGLVAIASLLAALGLLALRRH